MTKIAIRKCPICFTDQVEVLHKQKFTIPENVPLPEEYDIVCCSVCCFVYADTPNNQLQYEHYYAFHSKYQHEVPSSEDERRYTSVTNYLINFLKPQDKILDIGCSNGELLKHLYHRGYRQLSGIDPSPICIKHVNEQGLNGLELTLSNLKDNFETIGQHDVIILSHVMEHLVNPSEMMLAMKNLLHKDGLAYIEVPDASKYHAHFFKSFHYFDVEHINHFDQDSLKNLAYQAGFEMMDIGHKTISVSQTVEIPAVYILLKNSLVHSKPSLIKSDNLKNAMTYYIQLSNEKQDHDTIKQLAESQQPIILWGVGSYTQTLLQNSQLKDCNIVSIVDRDPKKQGLTIIDKSIQAPDALLKNKHSNAAILIASIPFAKEITQEILSMGLENQILIA